MSQNLRHALKHFWLWRKNTVLGNLALAIACSLAMRFSPIKHELLNLAFVGIPFMYALMGLTKDVFSWKYYQSLPLTKRELYHYHLLIQYPIYLPLLMWYFCFPDYTNDLFFEENRFSWKMSAIFTLFYLFGTLFIGLASFRVNYESVRKPYVKVDNKKALLQFLRNGVYIVSACIIAGMITLFASTEFSGFAEFLKWVGVFSAVSIIPAFYAWYYHSNFKRWNREELSYFKFNFKAVRDVPLMAIGCALISYTFQVSDDVATYTNMYGKGGNKGIFRAMQSLNLEEFNRLKNDPKQINAVTDTGWTPLMVAAHLGNGTFFQTLWDAGAVRTGTVNSRSDRIHHGLNLFMLAVDGKNKVAVNLLATPENLNAMVADRTALHVAAFNCHPEMIDLLLEKGANPNALNKGGSTALHVAARMNCFVGAVSLIEAGANPLLRNKKNEIAGDLLKHNNQFNYYLEKKGRLPAGK